MKKAMESTPSASDFIEITLRDAEYFIAQFEPPISNSPSSLGNQIADLHRIAIQLCRFDAMTRVANSPEMKQACSVMATRMPLEKGWRMKDGAADRAAEARGFSCMSGT
jgi:hypothetical protein